MTNRLTEILDDGTIHCFDVDKCMSEADIIVGQLQERDGEIDFDFGAVMFSLFITSIYVLRNYGWTREDLIKEVIDHYDIAEESDND